MTAAALLRAAQAGSEPEPAAPSLTAALVAIFGLTMTIEDAASRLGCGSNKVRSMVDAGLLERADVPGVFLVTTVSVLKVAGVGA